MKGLSLATAALLGVVSVAPASAAPASIEALDAATPTLAGASILPIGFGDDGPKTGHARGGRRSGKSSAMPDHSRPTNFHGESAEQHDQYLKRYGF